MSLYPAFEAALAASDHETLLRLYDAAVTQRDRAEAVLRALLNPRTSTRTIGAFTCTPDNSGSPAPTISAGHVSTPVRVRSLSASGSGKAPKAKAPDLRSRITSAI